VKLQVVLDRPLPASLPAGSGTALFCVGSCWVAGGPNDLQRNRERHPRLDRLEIVVDGVPHPAAAHGLPRPDVAAAHPAEPASRFSGFWTMLPIPARSGSGAIELRLRAAPAGGARSLEAPLGTIAIRPAGEATGTAEPPAPSAAPPGTIAVCMATFEPDETLFEAQIRSLRGQSDDRWICLISDDCSAPERSARIVEIVGEDPRFTISRSELRLGFYRNFERALTLVPGEIELVALCDQDDRWDPDKLAELRSGIGDGVLVYSDMRLVEADGRRRRDTLWRGRANNHENLASMLIANTITGAASLFRRELIELAVPFPDTPGFQFHDHWLAVVALAAGPVAYVDRPLYDYVQHPGAVFGDVTHGAGARPGLRHRVATLRVRGGVPAWRAAYFYGYLARQGLAHAALVRCTGRLTEPKRRALERFIACDSSWFALLWLMCRPLRALAGRTETLGTELELAQGIIWKRLIAIRARAWHHERGPLSDASIPPPQAFTQKRLRRWRARV
jgi:glycosyltransferase involved in cell wall biosynthesis